MKSLCKLFYADPQAYAAAYEKRFHDPDTVHLDLCIGENPAFFCQTTDLYRRMLSVERTNNAVNQLCGTLPGIALHQFQSRCLVDEIVLTNHIEGVQSTRKEITQILQDLSQNKKRERFVGLVNKYLCLMRRETLSLKTPTDIRKIYDDIFYEEIKENDPKDLPDGVIFRRDSVSVCSASGKEIHRGLYPEKKIILVMEKALQFLHTDSCDYLLRIAVFHYLFGYIHPFYDGNGRTSRFISSYLLSQKLNSSIGYRLSYTIKEHLPQYHEAFKICNHYNNKGDLTPFAEMFLEIVDISMKQLYEALSERSERLRHYESQIKRFPYAGDKSMYQLYDLLLQAALFSDSGITQKELEFHMGMSYNTVRAKLHKIPQDLLTETHQGKRAYMLCLKAIDQILEKEAYN